MKKRKKTNKDDPSNCLKHVKTLKVVVNASECVNLTRSSESITNISESSASNTKNNNEYDSDVSAASSASVVPKNSVIKISDVNASSDVTRSEEMEQMDTSSELPEVVELITAEPPTVEPPKKEKQKVFGSLFKKKSVELTAGAAATATAAAAETNKAVASTSAKAAPTAPATRSRKKAAAIVAAASKALQEEPIAPAGGSRRSSVDEDGFITPAKSSRGPQTQPPAITRTHNRYDTLQDTGKTDNTDSSNTDTKNANTNTRVKPPPAIIIQSKTDKHRELVTFIKSIVRGGFYIKYTRHNTNIYIADSLERRRFLAEIDSEEMEYFTYTDSRDKSHAFVLCGLDSSPDPQEVSDALKEEHNIDVRAVYKMTTKLYPRYLVITGTDKALKNMQGDVRYLMSVRVRWERHYNKKVIIQCHRCQQWGHATSNCRLLPRCMKCAGQHLSRECQREDNDPIKCCNCQGEHTANSIVCPVYLKKLSYRRQDLERRYPSRETQRYQDAPLPEHNIWETRHADQRQHPSQADRDRSGGGMAPPYQPIREHVPDNRQHGVSEQRQSRSPLLPTPRERDYWPPPGPRTRNQTQPPPQGCSQPLVPVADVGKMGQLFEQMEIFNSYFNVDNLLTFMIEVNARLAQCKNKADGFLTLMSFAKRIHEFNI